MIIVCACVLTGGASSTMLVLYGRLVKMGSMSWTSVIVIAKLARLERGRRLSWSCYTQKQIHTHTRFIWVLKWKKTSTIDLQSRASLCFISHRGINRELIGGCDLIVQSSGHGDGPSGPVDGEEWRRWLEGEEHAAARPLIRVCGVHHKHWCSNRSVLHTQTHRHRGTTVMLVKFIRGWTSTANINKDKRAALL